jgi:hypothetical protein
LEYGEDDFLAGPADLAVHVGSNKALAGTKYAVQRAEKHPDFCFETRLNDIALITIEGAFKFSEKVGPVCLPSKPAQDYVDQGLTLSGWGITLNKTLAKDLQILKNVKILSACPK